MIQFPCYHCRQILKARPEHAGQRTKCKHCHAIINIPPLIATGMPVPDEDSAGPDEYEVAPGTITYSRHVSMIPLIQRFLVITAIVCTVALGIMEVLILIPHSRVGEMVVGRSGSIWFAFVVTVGAWFGMMVSLATTYTLTEIVKALREKD